MSTKYVSSEMKEEALQASVVANERDDRRDIDTIVDGEGVESTHPNPENDEWGKAVRSLRDRIRNTWGMLHSVAIGRTGLETDQLGATSIAGAPEEIVTVVAMRPAILSSQAIAQLKATGALGGNWWEVPVPQIKGTIYPPNLGRMIVSRGYRLWMASIPGFSEVHLDKTGLLKKPGNLFVWLPSWVTWEAHEERHHRWIEYKDRTRRYSTTRRTLIRTRAVQVRVDDPGDPESYVAPKDVKPVYEWVSDTYTVDTLDQLNGRMGRLAMIEGTKLVHQSVDWKWRPAVYQQLVDHEALAELRDLLAEYEDLMSIRTLNEEGKLVKVGTPYGANEQPDMPVELSPSGKSFLTMPSLDPYDVHKYKTEEKRTLREYTDIIREPYPKGILKMPYMDGDQWATHAEPIVEMRERKLDGEYPEIDSSEEMARGHYNATDILEYYRTTGGHPEEAWRYIGPRASLFKPERAYDPGSVPAFRRRLRNSEKPDMVAIDVTKVWLELQNVPERWDKETESMVPLLEPHRVLGFNRTGSKPGEVPWTPEWYGYRAVWIERQRSMPKAKGVTWAQFHDAIQWLVAHKGGGLFHHAVETVLCDRLYGPKVRIKPAGKGWAGQSIPKWAKDQQLWINYDSTLADGTRMGTKARIFGRPPIWWDLNVEGMPLALYQVGTIGWDDEIAWAPANEPHVVQQRWEVHTFWCDDRDRSGDLGLARGTLVNAVLRCSVMNELVSRNRVPKATRVPKPASKPGRKRRLKGRTIKAPMVRTISRIWVKSSGMGPACPAWDAFRKEVR